MTSYVQHRRLWRDERYQWTVLDESSGYYIGVRADNLYGKSEALSKMDYEPVEPPERWVDITEHCFVNEKNELWLNDAHGGSINVTFYIEKTKDYRLRKVRVWANGTALGEALNTPQWAFLVERKAP